MLGNRSHQRPPTLRKVNNKAVEDDINKLFEAVNIRTCKSLDLSDTRRNASKKPMRAMGSHSPVIGFSEPVPLKQVLRGMRVSQAAEMAGVKKRLLEKAFSLPQDLKPATQSLVNSSSSCSVEEGGNPALSEKKMNPRNDEQFKSSKSLTGGSVQVSVPDPKAVKMAAPKVRQKPKSHPSSATKVSRDMKSGKNASTPIKPAAGNKSFAVKKSRKVVELKSEQLICHNCQCSIRITPESGVAADTSNKPVPAGTLNYKRNSDHLVLDKSNFILKNGEKGDNSYSSKSSNCDFSSSTPSISDESSPSGSTYGNRPHMSKDSKWRSIECIRKKYGFLGLNRFNLLKKLGSGDIGTVYLAELIGTGSLFAIKVMDNEFLAKRQKTGRAQTEGEILRMLDHPFLPTLYAQFTSDNLSCLVMEYCSGGDLHVLRQRQSGRRFFENDARFYVAEVLLALEYLHMLGIVYRDLKPENILVREDGHIMLTDFDLSLRCSVSPTLLKSASSSAVEPPRISGPCTGSSSCIIDPFCTTAGSSCFAPRIFFSGKKSKPKASSGSLLPQLVAEPTEARSNSFVGTHEYLAPEIIRGEGHGSSVDWWTLGILLYELLYGRTPFRGPSSSSGNEETLANAAAMDVDFPETTVPLVSPQARDLMRGLLVKEPRRRLGAETGAAEIKRHPFFDGLNWALIRSAVPPQVVKKNNKKLLVGDLEEFQLF